MRRVFCSAGPVRYSPLIIMSGQLLNFNLQNVLLGPRPWWRRDWFARPASWPHLRVPHRVRPGMAFYVLRLAVLPATWLGNAIAVVIVLMLMTTICAYP